jgi:predicted esterase
MQPMHIHHLSVNRTARIYQQGAISETTRYVWLTAHGYGMLGQYFIRKFEPLSSDEHVVIVPEALSRFYSEGLTGKIGASWMTAEDREHEIGDYIAYFEKAYETMIAPFLTEHIKVIALGFSQGSTAMFRWANASRYRIDHLIGWGGPIPPDVLANWKLTDTPVQMLIGDNDPFVPMDKLQEQMPGIQAVIPQIELHIYEGGHQIEADDLQALSARL